MKALLTILLLNFVSASDPIVSLSHGGKLQGKRTQLNGHVVDQFVGVRYAKPPVGERRFKKPEALEAWTGIQNATLSGDVCLQYQLVNSSLEITGDEDCLYLDITVPGGVTDGARKAVMVWIYGGGYISGAGSLYIGAPLAVQGDVVVVTMNYRLGVFGFLADENMGTGNYALWDQRAAIMWVKENIAAFGGNPELITIFGESAGAGSVVAQMMGAQNDGLSQRVIAQSGSLYQPWSWYLPLRWRAKIAKELKDQVGCPGNFSVFDCLREVDVIKIINMADLYKYEMIFHPVPDSDFFPMDINSETYNLANRFDLLVGYNDRDVSLYIIQQLNSYSTRLNESVNDGTSMAAASNYLSDLCQTAYVDSAVELCVDFFMDLYKLRELEDKQRYLTLIDLIKHHLFSADITRLLQYHSHSSKSTYAYQFEIIVDVPPERQPLLLPAWVGRKALHADDLFYVFGFDQYSSNITEAVKKTFTELDGDLVVKYVIQLDAEFATENDKQLSEMIQTYWTNFAKSGDPNNPVTVSAPAWPEFTSDKQMFMRLSDDMKPIEAPDLAIHKQIISLLHPARRREAANDIPHKVVAQVKEDIGTAGPCEAGDRNSALLFEQGLALIMFSTIFSLIIVL